LKGLYKKTIKVFLLPPAEIKLVILTLYWLIRIHLLMKRRVFKQVLEQIKVWSPTVSHSLKSTEPERICWIVEHSADALTSSFTCLPRALTGFIIFRKQGFDVSLRIGMRRIIPKAPMEAHAWLEIDGKIIMGYLPGMKKFVPFETFKGQYL